MGPVSGWAPESMWALALGTALTREQVPAYESATATLLVWA